jgi:hypothetical protein
MVVPPRSEATVEYRWSSPREYARRAVRVPLGLGLRGRRPRERPEWYADVTRLAQHQGLIIGGAPRSGTTLLRIILNGHPAIACGPETFLLAPDLSFNEFTLARRLGMTPSSVRRIEAAAGSYAIFVETLLRAYASEQGAFIWAEKTPRNILNIGWILDRFPEAIFVNLVRDGRAVVTSLLQRPHILAIGGRTPRDIDQLTQLAIARWQRSVRLGLEYQEHNRVVSLRYEDLVHNPRSTIAPLLERLGISWHENMARNDSGTSHGDPRYFADSANALEPVDPHRVDSWRVEAPPGVIERVEAACRPLLVQLGYLVDD